jgi:hypothetical protein
MNDLIIISTRRRTPEQRGIFAGQPFPDNPLPLWYVEAGREDCPGMVQAIGEADSEQLARDKALLRAASEADKGVSL